MPIFYESKIAEVPYNKKVFIYISSPYVSVRIAVGLVLCRLPRYGELCELISKRKYRASRTVNVFLAEISCNLPASRQALCQRMLHGQIVRYS